MGAWSPIAPAVANGGSLTSLETELVVLKTAVGDTSTGQVPLRITNRDSNGNLWATDNSTGVWKSTDDAVTWTTTGNTTGLSMTGNNFVWVTSTGTVLVVAQDATPVYHLCRSTDGGATFSKVFDFNSGSLGVLGSQSIAEDTSPSPKRLYVAEYCPTNQTSVNLYKSTDDGATWTAVYTFAQGVVRHFHAVRVDPFVTSRVWVTIGDTGTQPRIGYSDDGGTTFTWITQGQYPQSRAVGLIFASDAVYWLADTPDQSSDVYRYDRTSQQITTVTGRTFETPFYFAVQWQGLAAIFGGAETAGNGYTGDGFAAWVTGNLNTGQNYWSTVARWKRTQTSTTTPSVPYAITEPDSNGQFWVCHQALDGLQGITSSSESTVINFKLQLASKADVDQPRQDLRRMALGGAVTEFAVTHQPIQSFAATTQVALLVAPFDMILIDANFSVGVALASDATNYWTGSIRHFRSGSIVSGDPGGGVLLQIGGASQAWPALDSMTGGKVTNCPWIIKQGDVLVLRYEKAGTPSNIQNPMATIRFRRLTSLLS